MKKILLLSALWLTFSCSNNNGDAFITNNTPYLSSRTFIDEVDNFAQNEEFLVNNDGYLIKSIGSTYHGEFTYDSNGKLIKRVSFGKEFIYEYDAQGRIKKEIEIGVEECYIELFYESSTKIRSRAFYGHDNCVPLFSEYELTLGQQGRIIRSETSNPNHLITWRTYEYDANGNITTVVTKRKDSPAQIRFYTYEDLKNPYYDLLKKYYESAYYIKNFGGLGSPGDYKGVSPNILKTTSVFEANANGYPETEIHGNHGKVIYEYMD